MRRVWDSRCPIHFRSPPDTTCHMCNLVIYMRGGLEYGIILFWLELSFSSLRCRFLYPRGLSYRCLRPGVSWKLNRPRPVSFTSLPGRPFLPCFIPFKIFMLRLDVLGKPRFTYEQGSTAVLVCRSLFPCPPGVLHPRIEIFR